MSTMTRLGVLLLVISIFQSCQSEPLPVLGRTQEIDGQTVYHQIPNFAFVNQDSAVVTNETFAGKAYVADFFFTSCPSICPMVKQQMLRVHERFKDDDRLVLLSHTIDPKRDSVETLRRYAEGLGVSAPEWHFVTGDKTELYDIADDYFSIAIENADAPGGFDHSGRLILVDRNRHVRAFCNGTDPSEVDRFMKDIEKLLDEEYN